MTTMGIEMIGNVAIVVYGTRAPDDADYEQALRVLAANEKTMTGALAYSLGGGPTTSTQRFKAVKLWLGSARKPKVAVCTDSPLVRGMFTAIAWGIRESIQSFELRDTAEAALYVGVPPGLAHDALRRMVSALDRKVA